MRWYKIVICVSELNPMRRYKIVIYVSELMNWVSFSIRQPQIVKGERKFAKVIIMHKLQTIVQYNRFQGINSASLCSLAGRYDNPIPLWCLASIDSSSSVPTSKAR